MADGPFDPETGELIPRAPERADIVSLCRELNAREARYIVVGGFAIIEAGLPRTTGDLDLVIDPSLENEARVYAALATLPDGCVRELEAGEVEKNTSSCAWRMKSLSISWRKRRASTMPRRREAW